MKLVEDPQRAGELALAWAARTERLSVRWRGWRLRTGAQR